MKFAITFAYIFIVALGVVVFLQWKTIQKLIPAAPASDAGTTTHRTSGTFGDFVKATQEAIEPKEITVKY